MAFLIIQTLLLLLLLQFLEPCVAENSTYANPMLPGFYPDPSCIFVEELDQTFFCASSSFNAFPGIPIHASKDLRNWKLASNVLNRREQLTRLAITNGSTSGIWAPAIRYHEGTFWVITTLVHDKNPQEDPLRWENIIFKSTDPYNPSSWSNAVHFDFVGYDPSPFWHENGKVYLTGGHAWRVSPGIFQTTIDLETGKLDGPFVNIWNGTGGQAPEGPHIYHKDGWYYLIAAEGGTGVGHMETIARSKSIDGPFEANPNNPIVSNAGTDSYFQTVGHADMFQDASGNWWGAALSTRSGPEYVTYPMGRETVLAPVSWKEGEWPVWSNISGLMNGWEMPPINKDLLGIGPFVDAPDYLTFLPNSTIPPHLLHWRYPIPTSFTISPPGHPNTLRLTPSRLNLTALDGNYVGEEGQTFIGRRQSHTLFTFSVDIEFHPTILEEESGVSIFLTQNHHADCGIVLLHSSNSSNLIPHFRFRAISYVPVPAEIVAVNVTHYAFIAMPKGKQEDKITIAYVPGSIVSWGFTGVILGVFATANGGNGSTEAWISEWKYDNLINFRDINGTLI